MKKLRLDLDHLLVESFDTDGQAGEHGTVHGNALENCTCGCSGKTCDASCFGTCLTCKAPTDPCICDPIHPVTDFEGFA